MFFMLTEAAVGAGLVLFQLVADNATMARALFMAVHLLNTFILLACIALTAWWLSGGARLQVAGRLPAALAVLAGSVAILLVSSSGAVAALGDTLFPSSSLGEAHLLIRLRVLHPVLAVLTALALVVGAPRLARVSAGRATGFSRAVAALAGVQVVLGFANVLLLAPVWLQMLHLLTADGIWIAFVLLGAHALAAAPSREPSTVGQTLLVAPSR
jgi:heme A synthase